MQVHKTKALVRWMFNTPEDVMWFRPLDLFTKYGRRGRIKVQLYPFRHSSVKCEHADVAAVLRCDIYVHQPRNCSSCVSSDSGCIVDWYCLTGNLSLCSLRLATCPTAGVNGDARRHEVPV